MTKLDAWTMFAAGALQRAIGTPPDDSLQADLEKAGADKVAILAALMKYKRQRCAGIAEWADLMTEEWAQRSAHEKGEGVSPVAPQAREGAPDRSEGTDTESKA